jgi:amino acid transporter
VALAGVRGKNFSENALVPQTKDLSGLLRSSFITIFAYNGFQSIVQLSEEARDINDIPKGIYAAIGSSTGLYSVVALSVIALLGIKTASSSVNPIASALDYLVLNSKVDLHFVNILSSVALFNTLMLTILSRSRLLQKLSVRGLAPKMFSKLSNVGELLGIEKFKTQGDNKEPVTIPILAIVAVAAMSFAVTFIKEGAIESLATLTNSFIFIVFVIVHALVLINHHKTSQKKSGDKIKLLREYPWYAVAGLGISVVYLLKSFTYN